MAIARVQKATGTSASTTIVTATLATTVSGNLLIACVAVNNDVTGCSITSFTQAATIVVGSGASATQVFIFYRMNAPASTTVSATLTGGTAGDNAIWAAEYSGALTSLALDKTATSSAASSTAGSTGTTVATAQADEVAIGIICNGSALVGTSPSGGFTTVDSIANGGAVRETQIGERILVATGAQAYGVTFSGAAQWAGAIATFKAAAVVASTPAMVVMGNMF